MKLLQLLLFLITAGHCLAQNNPVATPVPVLADSLFFNMRYDEALPEYEKFIAANPASSLQTHARMGFAYHFTGKYPDAVQKYQDVLNKKPAQPLKAMLYSRMAMTQSRLHNREKALEYLDSAQANGYANSFELEHFNDFAYIRNDPSFRKILKEAERNAYLCKTRPEARQFDFWIGEWDVFLNAYPRHRVGSSSIQNVSGECTIMENWQSWNNSFNGKSQNWYDPNTKKWSQLWIGSGGGSQLFTDGEYKDGAMRFKFTQPDAKGYRQPGNFIFYNLGPDMVRQYNEVSADSGKTFNVVYDFIYKRRKRDSEKIIDEEKIRTLNRKYVDAWLLGDEEKVISLFSADAVIIPGSTSYKGIKNIRGFWFPKDGSVTTINHFSNDILSIDIDGDVAQSSQRSHLNWTYKNKSQKMSKEQWGYVSTVYKKQADGEWLIVYQAWKDYRVIDEK